MNDSIVRHCSTSAFASHWTHKHLDWHTTSQWLDNERGLVILAWYGAELAGYIGLSRPVAGCSWIRLLGIRDGRMPGQVNRRLMARRPKNNVPQAGIRSVAILMIANWLPDLLPGSSPLMSATKSSR